MKIYVLICPKRALFLSTKKRRDENREVSRFICTRLSDSVCVCVCAVNLLLNGVLDLVRYGMWI